MSPRVNIAKVVAYINLFPPMICKLKTWALKVQVFLFAVANRFDDFLKIVVMVTYSNGKVVKYKKNVRLPLWFSCLSSASFPCLPAQQNCSLSG
jgi:hypothetical protein